MISQNKMAIYNILGPIILNGINFFTIPVFTNVLGPEQFGIVSVYATWVSIFSIVLGVQSQGSIGTATIHLKKTEMKEYISSILIFSVLTAIIISFFLGYNSTILSSYLMMTKQSIYLMLIQAIGTFIIGFATITYTFYKMSNYTFVVNIISALSTTFLSIYLIYNVFSQENLYLGRMYGLAIPIAIISIFLFFYFIYQGRFTFKKEYVLFGLPICLPLIFHTLSHIVLGQSDRVMLQQLLGNTEAGIYSFMIVFASILTAVWAALNNTWVPFYYDDLKNHHILKISKKTNKYIEVYTIICIVFLLWSPEVVKVFVGKPYWSAIGLLPYFVVSNYFVFLYSFPVNFQFFNKRTRLIALGTVLAAIINIMLNYLLIPIYGLTGAAIGTLIAHISLFIFHEIIARYITKKYHYHVSYILRGCLVIFIVVTFNIFLSDYIFIRWGIGFLISLYLFIDIYIRRRLF